MGPSTLMDGDGKLLLISFSSIPSMDQHTTVVTGTVRALARLFESIDVVSIKGEYLAHIERFYNSRLLRVPLVGEDGAEQSESFRRAVRRQVESESYNVVHVRSPLEGLPVCQAKSEKGYRLVYEAGTFAFQDAVSYLGGKETPAGLEAQLRRDELTCVSQADLVIVHCETAKKALQTRGFGGPIEVIPTGVNIDVFDWEFALETSVPTLLCFGRLDSWRDVAGVFEAVRRVLDVTPVLLRWVGEPEADQRERMRAHGQELGIEQALSLEPPVEAQELPQLISSATVCLVPHAPTERFTEWGDHPPGLLEFMACQRPVVAARTAGIEEIVRDGTEALLYTPCDSGSLASSVLFLLRNTRHRRLLAKRGYRRVREQYCESSHRRQVLQAYRELLGLAAGYGKNLGELGKDSQPPPPPLSADQGDEPVTAVMRAAEESQGVRIDADTAQIRAAEEPLDTQPSIVLDQVEDEILEQSWSWQVHESAPPVRNGDVPPAHLETRKLPAVPPTPDDTSRFPALHLPPDPDPDQET